jgi:signal transduction histidine kinase
VWIEDVELDQNFPRLPVARKVGLHGGFAFPVVDGGQIHGLIELFSRRVERPDLELLEVFQTIGRQVGQFVRRKAGEVLEQERARHVALGADVGAALTGSLALPDALRGCTDALLKHLGAAFAHVWLLKEGDRVLEPAATSGLYVPLSEPHGRAPVGERMIGKIAAERKPYLTNDVPNDPLVSDRDWARHEGLIAFAGYPLILDDDLMGVVALFSRTALSGSTLTVLSGLADRIAIAIQRRKTEERLRTLNDTLEQSVRERTANLEDVLRELEAFAYSVAHDLRAPLRAMAGFSQILLEDYTRKPLDAEGEQCARRIVEAAGRMSALIEDLLAYSRLTRDELALHEVDLDQVVRDVLSAMAGEIADRKATVEIRGRIPAVVGHARTLDQVLTNLVSNALKFVLPGTLPRVSLRAEVRGGFVRLWVEDNGIGIAPEHQERIFRVFERVEAQEKYGGTGIGLAIVRRGMERMGGRSGLESAPGSGSKFWIEIPRSR